ncbi:unnamed protein product [Trichobilharzia regenti]|nr:unnamed protein product [Trichobilharzia regenti]
MVSSNPCKLSECNSLRGTPPKDRLRVARQTRLCLTRLQEVHTKENCEEVTKFSVKINVKSSSDYELCDDNGAVKKPVVTAGKQFLNGVSQTTLKFVQEKRVTISESSSDSTGLQGITSQNKGIKPLRIYEEEPKLSTVVIKDLENDEAEHTKGGKVDICDSGHVNVVEN